MIRIYFKDGKPGGEKERKEDRRREREREPKRMLEESVRSRAIDFVGGWDV